MNIVQKKKSMRNYSFITKIKINTRKQTFPNRMLELNINDIRDMWVKIWHLFTLNANFVSQDRRKFARMPLGCGEKMFQKFLEPLLANKHSTTHKLHQNPKSLYASKHATRVAGTVVTYPNTSLSLFNWNFNIVRYGNFEIGKLVVVSFTFAERQLYLSHWQRWRQILALCFLKCLALVVDGYKSFDERTKYLTVYNEKTSVEIVVNHAHMRTFGYFTNARLHSIGSETRLTDSFRSWSRCLVSERTVYCVFNAAFTRFDFECTTFIRIMYREEKKDHLSSFSFHFIVSISFDGDTQTFALTLSACCCLLFVRWHSSSGCCCAVSLPSKHYAHSENRLCLRFTLSLLL